MTQNVFTCPIEPCNWQHADDSLQSPDGATPDDLQALHDMHYEVIQSTLLDHYETHPVAAWVDIIGKLQMELQARSAPLLCFGCYVDRHNAQRAGQPLPPQAPVQLIVNGDGRCLNHVKLQDGPAIPGRTPGGIILGNGHMPQTGV